MPIDEKAMQFLEEHIPEQATMALKQAYWQALSSGSSVLICENGDLIEKHPDGTQRVLKKIAPSTPTILGQKWEIR